MGIEQTTNTSEKRAVLKLLVTLSIPTVLEQILSTLLQYVDTAMVGQLGEQATAAVSVTTTITWLVNSISSAFGVAVLAMIAKAVGSGDKKRAQGIAAQALLAVIVCGVVIGGISIILSPFIRFGWEQSRQCRSRLSIIFLSSVCRWYSVPRYDFGSSDTCHAEHKNTDAH